jgi:hypothetical protein
LLDIPTVPVGANGKKPVAVTFTTHVVVWPTWSVDGKHDTFVDVGAADAIGA